MVLIFFWFAGPLGKPGDLQGAEREGAGRVNLWPKFWTDARDEAKLPRRRRVARVDRDVMTMGFNWATAKSVKRGLFFRARRVRDTWVAERGLMGKISASQGGPTRGL